MKVFDVDRRLKKKKRKKCECSTCEPRGRERSGPTLASAASAPRINPRGPGHAFITVSALITLYLVFNTSPKTKGTRVCKPLVSV